MSHLSHPPRADNSNTAIRDRGDEEFIMRTNWLFEQLKVLPNFCCCSGLVQIYLPVPLSYRRLLITKSRLEVCVKLRKGRNLKELPICTQYCGPMIPRTSVPLKVPTKSAEPSQLLLPPLLAEQKDFRTAPPFLLNTPFRKPATAATMPSVGVRRRSADTSRSSTPTSSSRPAAPGGRRSPRGHFPASSSRPERQGATPPSPPPRRPAASRARGSCACARSASDRRITRH